MWTTLMKFFFFFCISVVLLKLSEVIICTLFVLFWFFLALFFHAVSKTPRPGEGLPLRPPPPPPVPGPVAAEVRIMEEERRSPQQEQDISETASSPVHTPHVSRAGSAALRSGEERHCSSNTQTQSVTVKRNQNLIICNGKFILILVCCFFHPQTLCLYFLHFFDRVFFG